MKATWACIAAVLMVMSLWSVAGSAAAEEAAKAEQAASQESPPPPDPVEALGVTEGKPMDTGFVFFDGRYIDAPYTVSRRGVCVLINNVVMYEWKRWPLPNRIVEEDPGLPQGLTEHSTIEDLRNREEPGNNIVARKLRHLRQHFPEEVVMDKIAEYFGEMPFVESVSFKSPGVLRLKLKNGEEKFVGVGRLPEDSAFSRHFTKEKLAERLDERRQYYETGLRKGGGLFRYSNGQELFFIRKKMAEDLGLVAETLRSDRPKGEKIRLLERMEILPPSSVMDRAELFHTLVTNFRASPQLEKRIAALVKKTGVKPRGYEDLPEELPIERDVRLRKEADRESKQP